VKLLDVGGGMGVNVMSLKKFGGFETYLIDRFTEYEPQYKNIMGTHNEGLSLMEALGVQVKRRDFVSDGLNYVDESFDIVTCIEVIEHIPGSCRNLLHEILRVLRPGGFILLGCPNIANLRYRISLLFGKSPHVDIRFWHKSNPYFGYYREYTPSEVRYMLQDAGFRNIKIETNEKRLLSLVKDRIIQRKTEEGRKGTLITKIGKRQVPFYLAGVLYYLIANNIPGLGYSIRAIAQKPLI